MGFADLNALCGIWLGGAAPGGGGDGEVVVHRRAEEDRLAIAIALLMAEEPL